MLGVIRHTSYATRHTSLAYRVGRVLIGRWKIPKNPKKSQKINEKEDYMNPDYDNIAIYSLQAGFDYAQLKKFIRETLGVVFSPEEWRKIREVRRVVKRTSRALGF